MDGEDESERGGNKKEFRKRELKQFYKNKKSAN
jgi:hypothetical protein